MSGGRDHDQGDSLSEWYEWGEVGRDCDQGDSLSGMSGERLGETVTRETH